MFCFAAGWRRRPATAAMKEPGRCAPPATPPPPCHVRGHVRAIRACPGRPGRGGDGYLSCAGCPGGRRRTQHAHRLQDADGQPGGADGADPGRPARLRQPGVPLAVPGRRTHRRHAGPAAHRRAEPRRHAPGADRAGQDIGDLPGPGESPGRQFLQRRAVRGAGNARRRVDHLRVRRGCHLAASRREEPQRACLYRRPDRPAQPGAGDGPAARRHRAGPRRGVGNSRCSWPISTG